MPSTMGLQERKKEKCAPKDNDSTSTIRRLLDDGPKEPPPGLGEIKPGAYRVCMIARLLGLRTPFSAVQHFTMGYEALRLASKARK